MSSSSIDRQSVDETCIPPPPSAIIPSEVCETTHFHRILDIFRRIAADALEKVIAKLRDNAFLALLLFAHHRKRLAGSRLAVGEDTHVIS